jgi:hypothetical protein
MSLNRATLKTDLTRVPGLIAKLAWFEDQLNLEGEKLCLENLFLFFEMALVTAGETRAMMRQLGIETSRPGAVIPEASAPKAPMPPDPRR